MRLSRQFQVYFFFFNEKILNAQKRKLVNYAVSTLLLSNYFYPISIHKTLWPNRHDKWHVGLLRMQVRNQWEAGSMVVEPSQVLNQWEAGCGTLTSKEALDT